MNRLWRKHYVQHEGAATLEQLERVGVGLRWEEDSCHRVYFRAFDAHGALISERVLGAGVTAFAVVRDVLGEALEDEVPMVLVGT